MLEFDESFFEGEEREGFFVEAEMKRVWAAQMEVLVEIDRICQKYNIQWYADYGTLLGAVRHKGFIPWDDDMDISMKREGYMRFMKVVKEELPKGWFCLSPQLERTWKQPFMRVVNTERFNMKQEHLQHFHGCPYPVGIDIFPIDCLPENQAELDMLKILYQDTLYIKELIKNEIEKEDKEIVKQIVEEKEKRIAELEEWLNFKVDRDGDVVNQMLCMSERLAALYTEEECSGLGVWCFMKVGKPDRIREKAWYEEAVPLPFENIMIPAPKGYDGVLRSDYGDYMTPVRGEAAHDYPFYKKYKNQVQEWAENVKTLNQRLSNLEENVL